MGGGVEDFDQQMRRRWHESRQRSRERHRLAVRRRRVSAGRRRAGLALAIALAVTLLASLTLAGSADEDGAGQTEPSTLASSGPNAGEASGGAPEVARALPTAAGLRDAWRYARKRGGQVSIAVVDTKGRLRQRDGSRSYASASVVKSMLLAAELQRLDRSSLPLDVGTQGLLKAMVTSSDNDAADAIYRRVGDTGLIDVAKAAGMRRFTVAGYWGNAQVTAADMARLFSRLDRAVPRTHRRVALALLAAVVPGQRWGVPAAAKGWTTHFKGGWRTTGLGQLVHQAALLRRGDRSVALAILTDAQPSQAYGRGTIFGVTARLLP
jgi:beta-lactamase class A